MLKIKRKNRKKVGEIIIPRNVERLANQIGINKNRLKNKVAETLSLLEHKGIDLDKTYKEGGLFIGFDMNGPLTNPRSAELEPWPHVPESVNLLKKIGGKKVDLGIVTGWDVKTTWRIAQSKILKGISKYTKFHVVGEIGKVYTKGPKGIVRKIARMDVAGKDVEMLNEKSILYDIHSKFMKGILEIAGKRNLQIALQPNRSNTQCVYIEGYERGGVKDHILVNKRRYDQKNVTRRLFNEMKKRNLPVKFLDGEILIEKLDSRTAKELHEILSQKYPLIPIRVKKDGRKLKIKVDVIDKKISLSDVSDISNEIKEKIPLVDDFDVNPDYSVDFDLKVPQLSKEYSASLLARVLHGEDHIMSMVGDSGSDIVNLPKSIFFAMEGTKAEKKAREKGIPHVKVRDGREYALIWATILYNLKQKTGK